MKIKPRDIGLLAMGFFLGAIVTASLTSTSTRPPVAPAATIVATGPVFAAASIPPPFIVTNIVFESPPQFLDSFDSRNPPYPPALKRLDLIDTRYQPDFKLNDLK